MKMGITIRPATINDAALISDLSRQTFYEAFAAQNTKESMNKFLSEQFTKEALIKEVGEENNIFFLAYYDNEVAGYVRLRENNIPPGLGTIQAIEIARIYVVGSFIGKGIGAALMQKSIDIAMEKKRECLWLGVWQENQRAIDFYTRWGFKKFAHHDFRLGDDIQQDWLMKKPL